MQQANIKNSFSSSSLTRLLAGLPDPTGRTALTEVPPKGLAAGLGAWLDWTQAIALSAALGDAAANGPQVAGADREVLRSATQAVRRGREARRQAITSDAVLTAAQAAGIETCRSRCKVHQQAMATAASGLRAQLRTALAAASAAGARLAALDGVLGAALAPREAQLLAGVIGRLDGLPAQEAGRTVRTLLLAELDLRWQPLEALLAALAGAPQQAPEATN